MKKSQKKSLEKYEILSGHQKVGSTYTRFPNMLSETSYVEDTLPELLWIALLNDAVGERKAVQIVSAISESVPQAHDDKAPWFVFSSALASLPKEVVLDIKACLADRQLLSNLQSSLSSFFYLYPSFPVHWFDLTAKEDVRNVSIILRQIF